MNTNLNLEPVASNSDRFYSIPPDDDDTEERHGGLQIDYEDSKTFGIYPNGTIFPPPKPWSAEMKLSENEVFILAEQCRATWRKNTVDLEEKDGSHPFQSTLNFSSRLDLYRRVCGKLALAGQTLFFSLFEREKDNKALLDIAQRLRNKSIQSKMALTITSGSFFIPWGMIYTHPDSKVGLNLDDGSNFEPEGFWGYRHIIEHNPEWFGCSNVLERDEKQLIRTSMNLDELIDDNLEIQSVRKQREFFEQLVKDNVLKYEERCFKPQLRKALEAEDFSDRILYFYCHGESANVNDDPSIRVANIKLTDREPINGIDIAQWLRLKEDGFETQPLIFINACKGGQMTTMFFKTFAAEFLKSRARGLIGAQIDIPAEFGADYAQRLFSEFLKGSQPPEKKIRLGKLMRDLAREYLDEYKNPLGLIYSLYRGMDVYVDRRPAVVATS